MARKFSDTRLRKILGDSNLPTDTDTIQRLRDDLEIAEEVFLMDPGRWPTTDQANRLAKACDVLIGLREEHNLLSKAFWDELGKFRAWMEYAPGMRTHLKNRPWLAPACANFLSTWRALTNAPDGIYEDGRAPSPTLAFLHACCQLIDREVPTSAIVRRKAIIKEMAL